MPEAPRPRSRWRPRLTIGALMLVIAVLGLWFTWTAHNAHRLIVVDLGAPDLIAVGDRPHTLASLKHHIRGGRVREAVIRAPNNMPYSSLMAVVQAIEAAGNHQIQIQISAPNGPPNAALRRVQPAATAPK